jgi:hypothetical protein
MNHRKKTSACPKKVDNAHRERGRTERTAVPESASEKGEHTVPVNSRGCDRPASAHRETDPHPQKTGSADLIEL